MHITMETILHTFDTAGLRSTRPRRLIARRLAELARATRDFATEDLWHELQRADPRLGRATVYRAVETLVDQGVLDRVEFADGTHRYRVCGGTAHHHHLTCTLCHRIVEVQVCLPRDQFSSIASDTDFAIDGHSVELFGRCAACRAEQSVTR
jgi:Fe2+ or Zn2+ uptake regulation protein